MMKSAAYLLMFVVFVLITWQSIVRAMGMIDSGQYSEVLYLPIYPFIFVVTLGCCGTQPGCSEIIHSISK